MSPEASRTQPFADAARTRLTYVMLFRVGLVTLLLAILGLLNVLPFSATVIFGLIAMLAIARLT